VNRRLVLAPSVTERVEEAGVSVQGGFCVTEKLTLAVRVMPFAVALIFRE